ncbi:MAG: hypothetical protein M3P96_08285 [Actinomycetota bacterium]|nr:hypothetical protein [Actinomycetota bacterium]
MAATGWVKTVAGRTAECSAALIFQLSSFAAVSHAASWGASDSARSGGRGRAASWARARTISGVTVVRGGGIVMVDLLPGSVISHAHVLVLQFLVAQDVASRQVPDDESLVHQERMLGDLRGEVEVLLHEDKVIARWSLID